MTKTSPPDQPRYKNTPDQPRNTETADQMKNTETSDQPHYSYRNNLDPASYDEFVKNHPQANLLQSASWGKIKDTWGHRLVGLVNEQEEIVAAGLLLLRPVKFGWTVWYMPHGPILDYENKEIVSLFFSSLQKDARKQKCAFIKIDPPVFAAKSLYADFTDGVSPEAQIAKANLEQVGFRHQGFSKNMQDTIQPRYHAITFADDRPLEDRISKRSRSALKDSRKRQVQVIRGTVQDLDDFYYLIQKTEAAKDINLRNQAYFRKLMEVYGDDAFLYLAIIDLKEAIAKHESMKVDVQERMAALPPNAPKKRLEYENRLASYEKLLNIFQDMRKKEGDKAILAGCLSVLYGPSFEMLYAGFNRDYAFIPAQDPVYIASMQAAFAQGAKYASMGGVEGDLQDSLMEYKNHFDPHVVAFLGEFDLPINKLLYQAYLLLRKLKK
ncbi:MAG: peptidoglycan bridge formation glycyltransferase FemA/FemB family protein [Eubacteriales bacterium]|nr:peptidoglycan bridge formation glycyltransferase FemA/FemB family protein [Eubacteriales bacterium]